ncbi:unnamed protein product [Rotaria socialis]|uniref:Uncharacterized protein n=1 Tax=Rotaria socialis TaxID=392032 RepID=A0A818SPB4_9BILA|nr:unnamed protein product [Rotaria socialis]CAF4521233.1 unnamed protein product [Rotaria socialis]
MCFTSIKNIDPKPSKEVQDLQDELNLSTIEWMQAFKDLNEKVANAEENNKKLEENNKKLEENNKTLEENNKKLEETHSTDIKFIVSLLVNEMIENLDDEKNNAKQKYKSDSFHQHGAKKARFE